MHEPNSQKIAAAVAIVHEAIARVAALTDAKTPGAAGVSLRAVAERLYSERRRRAEYFPVGLFGEPAWDLLLALFIAHEDGRELDLADAYKAADVEPGAGPALLQRLEASGLVARCRRQGDEVHQSLRLTDRAVERLGDYLTDII